jgi:hypothetical protein
MATPPEISPDSVRHYGSGYEAAARQACRELENETRRYSAEAASRVAVDSLMLELIANPDGPQKLGSRLEQQNITPDPRELYMQTPDCRPSPVVSIVFPKPAPKQHCGYFSEESLGKSEHQYQPGHEEVSRKMLRALEEDAMRASAHRAQESQTIELPNGIVLEKVLSPLPISQESTTGSSFAIKPEERAADLRAHDSKLNLLLEKRNRIGPIIDDGKPIKIKLTLSRMPDFPYPNVDYRNMSEHDRAKSHHEYAMHYVWVEQYRAELERRSKEPPARRLPPSPELPKVRTEQERPAQKPKPPPEPRKPKNRRKREARRAEANK